MTDVLKAGSRWKSAVCDTEAVVVQAAKPAVLECGGVPMLPHTAARPEGPSIKPEFASGTLLGKRYGDEELGLTVLCTKAGKGSLSVAGSPLAAREAKRLPSSD